MTTKHTPGPWRAQGKYKTEISGPEGTYIIADLGRPSDPEVCGLMQADARLIAAAPELLAVLAELVECVGYENEKHLGDGTLMVLDGARAAIARARGGES